MEHRNAAFSLFLLFNFCLFFSNTCPLLLCFTFYLMSLLSNPTPEPLLLGVLGVSNPTLLTSFPLLLRSVLSTASHTSPCVLHSLLFTHSPLAGACDGGYGDVGGTNGRVGMCDLSDLF